MNVGPTSLPLDVGRGEVDATGHACAFSVTRPVFPLSLVPFPFSLFPLYPPSPGPYGGVAATVSVKLRQRIGCAGLVADTDQYATAAGQCFEDVAVVALETGPTDGRPQPLPGEAVVIALERTNQGATRKDLTEGLQFDALG